MTTLPPPKFGPNPHRQVFNTTNQAMLDQMNAALATTTNPAAASIATTIEALNQSFVQVFTAVTMSLPDAVNISTEILGEFNATLAYNPYTQARGPALLVFFRKSRGSECCPVPRVRASKADPGAAAPRCVDNGTCCEAAHSNHLPHPSSQTAGSLAS